MGDDVDIDIGDVEEEVVPPTVVAVPQPMYQTTGFDMMHWLKRCFGQGLLQIFGDSKVGKTKTVLEIARRLKKQGYRVKYVDTERNLDDQQVKESGVEYVYANSLESLQRAVNKITYIPAPEAWDVVIVDSVSIFITDQWGELNLNQHGKLIQDIQVICGKLRNYCIGKGCVGIVVFQPTSKMSDKPLAAMGDKSDFQIKNQLYLRGQQDKQGRFIHRGLEVYHCRRYEDGMFISEIKIGDDGVTFDEAKMAAMR